MKTERIAVRPARRPRRQSQRRRTHARGVCAHGRARKHAAQAESWIALSGEQSTSEAISRARRECPTSVSRVSRVRERGAMLTSDCHQRYF